MALVLATAGTAVVAAGCGDSTDDSSAKLTGGTGGTGGGSNVQALFVVPDSLDKLATGCSEASFTLEVTGECSPTFWDHPWPSDFRKKSDGTVSYTGYPNPTNTGLLNTYISEADSLGLKGFSPHAAGYLRFNGDIDPATLPADPKAAMEATSTVQLIDVDANSPEKGQRRQVTLYWREKEGVYWNPDTLAFQATFGYPLRPATQYALVVTTGVKDKQGVPIGRSKDLDTVLGLSDGSTQAKALQSAWSSAVGVIESTGVAKSSIAHLTVFTTDDPTAETFSIRDYIHKSVPAPTAKDWATKSSSARYDEYVGNFGPNPNFQIGKMPFKALGDGGGFEFDANGNPKTNADVPEYDLRFSLTVPKEAVCPMPANGYPVVLYAHGTGGDYRSYVGDGTADALAQHCVASMGVDQIFHGTRPGAPANPNDVEVIFFNFFNPEAARTNARQSALDEVQRARLFTESSTSLPASVSVTGSEIKFDPAKVMFFGHSQGGLNGPLYLAADDSALGGVLSGSGSIISITLLEKTKPVDITALVSDVLLQLNDETREELNELHPMISLAQSIVDPVDPIHYVRHLVREPRPGFKPKSIYQTEGVNPDGTGDNYTPPHAIEVQSIATGLPRQAPGIIEIEEDKWGGPGTVTVPAGGLSGNLASGQASGILAQWPASQASDGHFVVFDIEAARQQAAGFCENLGKDPKGKIPAPLEQEPQRKNRALNPGPGFYNRENLISRRVARTRRRKAQTSPRSSLDLEGVG
ncbi:MAG: hypothetical protein U0165_17700 [Polyangiaceae bacterium]